VIRVQQQKQQAKAIATAVYDDANSNCSADSTGKPFGLEHDFTSSNAAIPVACASKVQQRQQQWKAG